MKPVYFFLLGLILLSNCGQEEIPPECFNALCEERSYAFIDKVTHENLMGYEPGQINPDSIYFITDEGNTMPIRVNYWDILDWWDVSFMYYDELKRCDLEKTDSTFYLTYYIHLGSTDIDTLDIRIAPCRDPDAIFFNGSEDVNWQEDHPNYSSYYLRK